MRTVLLPALKIVALVAVAWIALLLMSDPAAPLHNVACALWDWKQQCG